MIQELIAEVEMELKYKIYLEQKNLAVVKNFKELISQIDHNAEVVICEDKERLSRLLVSLKGKDLSETEQHMIDRIIQH